MYWDEIVCKYAFDIMFINESFRHLDSTYKYEHDIYLSINIVYNKDRVDKDVQSNYNNYYCLKNNEYKNVGWNKAAPMGISIN